MLIGKIRGHECIAVEQAAVLPELLSLRLGECLSNAAGAGQGKVHEYRRDDGAEDTLAAVRAERRNASMVPPDTAQSTA